MKKLVLKPFWGMALVAFITSGCEQLEKADDISFSTTFTLPEPFVVDEESDEPENPYVSINSSIEADQDPEVQKYKDKIKKIVVNEVTYTISDFAADEAVVLNSGTATFFALGESSASGVIASVTNLPLANGSGTLDINQAGLETIGDILLEDGEVIVLSTATLSNAPVTFKITVTLNVTITANALD